MRIPLSKATSAVSFTDIERVRKATPPLITQFGFPKKQVRYSDTTRVFLPLIYGYFSLVQALDCLQVTFLQLLEI